ncbi:MAG TPA: hypothetical protein EYP78_02690 [Candidatus Omnitrophica bacterium]|nr:hypothetical protein [Candidatus Omnitrophota bacterium]
MYIKITGKDSMRHAGFLRVEPSSRYYMIGASIEPWEDAVRGSAQIGFQFLNDRLTVRGGVIEASPGIGFDYGLPDSRTILTLEGFDNSPDSSPYLRFRLSYRVWKNYFLTLGAADFSDESTFTLGARIEYDFLDAMGIAGSCQ